MPLASAGRRARAHRSRRHADDVVFKALADPTRREILGLLRGGQRSVGEIAGNFRISRPAVSKHLRMLRDAGLVHDRAEGTSTMCSLNPAPLRQVETWLSDYTAFWTHNLAALKAHVEKST
ncbi:transcriptional regulator [Vulcanimicrobium alpinum]|uniref:Transcriptional regulator n=1 Tax=Vulcanimicrobium alpinum TaxID=3016050 RepID=A0AAN1Y037_UNVUL|nr:metalloregulator ArsR/SmtB family transcription factor [Vulcanimicrobium alpinum]BDE08170.1 transcriptional regulator [Vulcanimicrobium alpinum]